MWQTIKRDWLSLFAIVFFGVYSLWWFLIQFTSTEVHASQLDIFTTTYGLMAVWGGTWGIVIARSWGGLKSVMGKMIIFFSLGLLAQELGQILYTYYIYVLGVEVPYPSLGDIGYFGSIPLYIIGAIYLAKASGVKISLKSFTSKIQAIIIPAVILTAAYFIFLFGYEFDFSSPLTVFLDFAYPLGQAVYISIALLTYLLTRKMLGGIMKGKIIFILIALTVQFMADFIFLYQASRGAWGISGISDYIYFIAYFIMALALFQLKTVARSIKENN